MIPFGTNWRLICLNGEWEEKLKTFRNTVYQLQFYDNSIKLSILRIQRIVSKDKKDMFVNWVNVKSILLFPFLWYLLIYSWVKFSWVIYNKDFGFIKDNVSLRTSEALVAMLAIRTQLGTLDMGLHWRGLSRPKAMLLHLPGRGT